MYDIRLCFRNSIGLCHGSVALSGLSLFTALAYLDRRTDYIYSDNFIDLHIHEEDGCCLENNAYRVSFMRSNSDFFVYYKMCS